MSAYVNEVRRATRTDEAYHLLAQRREASVERERQRALLSEWAQATFLALGLPGKRGLSTLISDSDFGLWIKHKARLFFDDESDLVHVHEIMNHIDDALLPQLQAKELEVESKEKLIDSLATKVELIRYLTADMFTRAEQLEHCVDPLTRLPNRRYLPAVLVREIDEHKKNNRRFSVILARPCGAPVHDGAELSQESMLQRFAAVLVGTARPGDHLFRYIENQFVVVTVESTREQSDWLATQIQLASKEAVGELKGPGARICVGIAEFDGHPDPEYLLKRAEKALSEAILADAPDTIAHA